MSKCKAYKPEFGYRYQILVKFSDSRSYEHCDYCIDTKDRDFLLNEYRLAYKNNYTLKVITLPRIYWDF